MLNWPAKDPDEILDYQIKWGARLGDDTIATSSWAVPDGITEVSNENDSTSTTIKLSGGTVGMKYVLTNTITTDGQRTMEQSVSILITQR